MKGVLLVTIDTWRWDHIGVSGLGLVETPRLDELAKGGRYVPRVETTCPLTTPAHATILTGLRPRGHGIRDNHHFSLKAGIPTMAELFSAAGYSTGAIVAAAPLRRIYGLDRGFESYDDSGLAREGWDDLVPASIEGSVATDRALAWFRSKPADRPLFLWVHYYDPHDPYTPPPPFAERYRGRPYAGEVAFVDEQIGRLVDALRVDSSRSWTVVVTGDHGEGLGDHDEETHGLMLYSSTIQVPLLLWRPSPLPVPSFDSVSLVDLLPTVAALVGLKAPVCDGVDLFGTDPGERWLGAESALPAISFGLAPPIRLRRGDRVLLDQGGSAEVFDTVADPRETSDLGASADGKALAAAARSARTALFGTEMGRELSRSTLTPPREQTRALESLGYLSGGSTRRALTRVDLRLFARDFASLQQARKAFGAHRHAEAATLYERFLDKYPTASKAWQELGMVRLRLNRPPEAEVAFRAALAADPADSVSALNLGNLRVAANDFSGAEKLFLQSLAAEEAQPEVHLNLGLLYSQILKRPEAARKHFLRFLELSPKDPEAPKIRALLDAGSDRSRP